MKFRLKIRWSEWRFWRRRWEGKKQVQRGTGREQSERAKMSFPEVPFEDGRREGSL